MLGCLFLESGWLRAGCSDCLKDESLRCLGDKVRVRLGGV